MSANELLGIMIFLLCFGFLMGFALGVHVSIKEWHKEQP